jgi:hypothetical protein
LHIVVQQRRGLTGSGQYFFVHDNDELDLDLDLDDDEDEDQEGHRHKRRAIDNHAQQIALDLVHTFQKAVNDVASHLSSWRFSTILVTTSTFSDAQLALCNLCHTLVKNSVGMVNRISHWQSACDESAARY